MVFKLVRRIGFACCDVYRFKGGIKHIAFLPAIQVNHGASVKVNVQPAVSQFISDQQRYIYRPEFIVGGLVTAAGCGKASCSVTVTVSNIDHLYDIPFVIPERFIYLAVVEAGAETHPVAEYFRITHTGTEGRSEPGAFLSFLKVRGIARV